MSVSFSDAGTWWSAGKEKGLSKCLMNEQIPSETIQEGGAQESGLRLGLFPGQGGAALAYSPVLEKITLKVIKIHNVI